MTNTKNLHNLLWIYAPDQSASNPSMYYPGDEYVDITALGELDPHTKDEQFDFGKWPPAIANKFTKISYFFSWRGIRSPVANKNATVLYNDKHVVNRGQINCTDYYLSKCSIINLTLISQMQGVLDFPRDL